jgi:hypothetical protein
MEYGVEVQGWVKYLERRMAEEEEGRRRKEEMVAGYLK